VDGAAGPVDVAFWIDAADLIESTTRSEIEPVEALVARMERVQQLRLFVEVKDARTRLVLSTLDAAERIPEVVAFLDGTLEDRLQRSALTSNRAL
jgi:hypothetical protein